MSHGIMDISTEKRKSSKCWNTLTIMFENSFARHIFTTSFCILSYNFYFVKTLKDNYEMFQYVLFETLFVMKCQYFGLLSGVI